MKNRKIQDKLRDSERFLLEVKELKQNINSSNMNLSDELRKCNEDLEKNSSRLFLLVYAYVDLNPKLKYSDFKRICPNVYTESSFCRMRKYVLFSKKCKNALRVSEYSLRNLMPIVNNLTQEQIDALDKFLGSSDLTVESTETYVDSLRKEIKPKKEKTKDSKAMTLVQIVKDLEQVGLALMSIGKDVQLDDNVYSSIQKTLKNINETLKSHTKEEVSKNEITVQLESFETSSSENFPPVSKDTSVQSTKRKRNSDSTLSKNNDTTLELPLVYEKEEPQKSTSSSMFYNALSEIILGDCKCENSIKITKMNDLIEKMAKAEKVSEPLPKKSMEIVCKIVYGEIKLEEFQDVCTYNDFVEVIKKYP